MCGIGAPSMGGFEAKAPTSPGPGCSMPIKIKGSSPFLNNSSMP